jgi:polar amino acid transport system substrate-binding protein
MQLENSLIARGSPLSPASRLTVLLTFVAIGCAATLPASAATLDRIKESGRIKLGYLVDASPFTSRNQAGDVEGYGAALCGQVAEQIKTQLSLTNLTVDWVPVMGDDRLREVQQGNVDLMCAPAAATLSRRQEVSFSIPVFPAGVRAVLRADAPQALRDALSETPNTKPVWRGSPAAKVLEKTKFVVVSGTTTEEWLARGLRKFQLEATVVTVPDYRTALQQLQDRKADVFFGDRAVVLGALDPTARKNFLILDRMLTHEPVALAMARGDEDFHLLVDRALSQTYASSSFGDLYRKWIGDYDQGTRTFFQWVTLQP